MKDLYELKRLLAAATPGPWLGIKRDSSFEDAALAVAAVNALPHLIAEIERLRLRRPIVTAGECWCEAHQGFFKHEDGKRIERLEATLREIEAIEFGRGLEVAKQIARTARTPGK